MKKIVGAVGVSLMSLFAVSCDDSKSDSEIIKEVVKAPDLYSFVVNSNSGTGGPVVNSTVRVSIGSSTISIGQSTYTLVQKFTENKDEYRYNYSGGNLQAGGDGTLTINFVNQVFSVTDSTGANFSGSFIQTIPFQTNS